MINRNGVLYMKVETPGVHVLDETSEVHLVKGRFEEQRKAEEEGERIDLSGLTGFTGSRFGRLFSFKDGVKSGFTMISTMAKRKKTAKRLRRVMAFFAIVFVFVVARFGVGIKDYFEAKSNYNKQVVSVSLGMIDGSLEDSIRELLDAKGDPKSGIRQVVLNAYYMFDYETGFAEFQLLPSAFETYSKGMLSFVSEDSDRFRAPVLPESDRGNLKALSGQGSTSDTYEILITKNVADKLLKNPTFSFINSYDDLVGMFFESNLVDSKDYYERMMRRATDSDDQDYEPKYAYDPDLDRYYYYNLEDDSYTYLDYGEVPKGMEEKQRYFRIAGVLNSDELVVYLNDDMFTDSVISLSMPDQKVMENYASALVFSDDPDKTVSYLDKLGINAHAAKQELEEELKSAKGEMFGYLSTMAMLIAVLCVCMYFIMRAVYMNRMKEIGTYRAIGVSKRNMLFRSFVETGVMTTLSAFVGYLLTVGFIAYLRSFSSKTENFFYMPWWLAILVLLLIYVICLFSGTISVRSVLRKTPAEIMAKYDI